MTDQEVQLLLADLAIIIQLAVPLPGRLTIGREMQRQMSRLARAGQRHAPSLDQ